MSLLHTSNPSCRYPRCILGTCCIPWTADFQFDESLFRRGVAHLLQHGTRHLYVFGTAGEGYAVSDRQFQQITRAFADEMFAGEVTPMVGVISTSLSQVLDRIAWAQNIGVTQFQLSLPSWGTCTELEAFTFFEQVCTRFPQCSFLHYNVRRAGRLLQPPEYGRLVEAFPNLVAAKLAGATADDAVAVYQAAPAMRLFLTEIAFGECCAQGVPAGFLISIASFNWRIAQHYFESVLAGDTTSVATHHQEQRSVDQALTEAVGRSVHMDGAYDQMLTKQSLREFPLRLLPPYVAANDAEFALFVDAVRACCPAWLD